MSPKRRILLRAGGFLIAFAIFVYPWSWAGWLFTQGFSAVANVAIDATLNDSEVHARFEPTDPRADGASSPGEWDTVLTLKRTSAAPATEFPLGIRRLGYVPLATFAALVLATPVDRRRKVVLAGVGMTLLLLRFALAVALPLARSVGALGDGSFGGWIASVAYYALIEPPNMMYGAPVIVWLLTLLVIAPETFTWMTRLVAERAAAPHGGASPVRALQPPGR
ncbi:MAG TPA: hypothetical protein VGY54_10790 [Polyangiaceae bacterium]|jgi:hypothetical protein|nr:hypothetical protein [Polyangiaceae bacterium]